MSGVFIATAVIGAAATVYSSQQQSKAAKAQAAAQRDATAAQGRMSSADAARERIKQAREARVRRAQIVSAGSNAGLGTGGGTSGISGAVGSVSSQMASNIGTINQTEGFAAEISAANQRGADAQTDMMKWQAWGNVGQTIFSQSASRIT